MTIHKFCWCTNEQCNGRTYWLACCRMVWASRMISSCNAMKQMGNVCNPQLHSLQQHNPYQAAVDVLQVKQLHGNNLVPQGLAASAPDLRRQRLTAKPKTLNVKPARKQEKKSYSRADAATALLKKLIAFSVCWKALRTARKQHI